MDNQKDLLSRVYIDHGHDAVNGIEQWVQAVFGYPGSDLWDPSTEVLLVYSYWGGIRSSCTLSIPLVPEDRQKTLSVPQLLKQLPNLLVWALWISTLPPSVVIASEIKYLQVVP